MNRAIELSRDVLTVPTEFDISAGGQVIGRKNKNKKKTPPLLVFDAFLCELLVPMYFWECEFIK